MAERISKLGFRNDIVGGVRSSGPGPSSVTEPLDNLLAGVNAIARNEQAEKRLQIRNKEKALKTYLDTINVDYKTKIDVYSKETPRNPDAIVKKGQSYRDGIVNSAPTELQGLIGARIDNYINVKRAAANKMAVKETQDQALANEERLSVKNFAILKEASGGLYSADDDLRESSINEIEALESELVVRLFSQGVDNFGAVFNAHSKEDITERLQNFRDVSQSSAIKEWFREQESPEKAFLQLKRGGFKVTVSNFKRNKDGSKVDETFKEVDVVDALSQPAQKKLFEDIGSEIKTINEIADKQEKIEEEEDKKNQRITGFDNWRKIEDPNLNEEALTPDMIRQQLESNLITKDDAVAQLKSITDISREDDDPDVYDTIDRMIDRNDDPEEVLKIINEVYTEGLLSEESAAMFRGENRANITRERTSIQKSIDEISKETIKDLNTGLKVNTIFTILDKDQGLRQVRARQEARRRIQQILNEAPIETEEELDIFREKLNNLNNELIRTHRFKERGTPALPSVVPAATREQVTKEKLKEGWVELNRQKDNGDISQEEFNKQARNLMDELQREKAKDVINEEQ